MPPNEEIRQLICPVCGRAAGQRATRPYRNKPYIKTGSTSFWETIGAFPEGKDFGVIQEGGGAVPFTLVGTFGPDDDPDGYHEACAGRLLWAVREWVHRGYMTKEEVINAIK